MRPNDSRRGAGRVRAGAALLWWLWLAATPCAAQAPARSAMDLQALSRTLEALSDRVGPAVVQIFALGYVPSDLLSEDRSPVLAPQRSSGSGVILDPRGYIVTNAHVVQGAHRLQVELSAARGEGQSVLPPRPRLVGAQLVALDLETDLAVLKVAETNLPALELADSDRVRPGQIVLAFGSPLGLNSSVTMGVVSAVARQLEPDDPMIFIQTDASINPGNSGGPLVDLDGRVVGINTMILSQSGGNEGLGFAAPSNIVKAVFTQVRDFGRVRRGEIGVRAQSITPALAEGLGLDRREGVILSDVYPGGPAALAGLAPGDVVVTLDGKPMENGRQFQVNLYSRMVGDQVSLEVRRGASPMAVRVSVVERPNDPGRFAGQVRPQDHFVPRLGILGLSVDAPLLERLPGLRIAEGVIVATTSSDVPPSWDGRLLVGDVIHAVNREAVTSLESLRQAVARLRPGDALVLQVERDGELVYVGARVE